MMATIETRPGQNVKNIIFAVNLRISINLVKVYDDVAFVYNKSISCDPL